MSLYCLKCGAMVNKKHNPDCLEIISVKRECKGIVDRLYSLGLRPTRAHWYNNLVNDTLEHKLQIYIEIKNQFPYEVLGDIPAGWVWYTHTVTPDDDSPITILAYVETYVWWGSESITQRIKRILKDLEEHLDTIDKEGFQAVITFVCS